MTSVKEFEIEQAATRSATGRGRFLFTDAYSVFDWGRMPDAIPDKGASLCVMGAANFELLEAEGVPTHYRGVVAPDGDEPVPLAAVETLPRVMAIELVSVPELPFVGRGEPANGAGGEPTDDGEPTSRTALASDAGKPTGDADGEPTSDTEPGVVNGYDYGAYYEAVESNYLVPLEVVFRNAVPVGSSLRRRREPSEVGLDTEEWPDEPVTLPEPVVEFSTKFEERDRYLTRGEADRIAGPASVERLATLAREVNRLVTDRAQSAGLTHEDGKIECYYADGEVGVADVVGTLDENRFSVDGQQLSKEVVRQYYKREHPDWVETVSAAKRRADERGVADWRPLCEQSPPALPAQVIETVADAYRAAADALHRAGDTDASPLFDAPPLSEVVRRVSQL